jgi:hypothetical protein
MKNSFYIIVRLDFWGPFGASAGVVLGSKSIHQDVLFKYGFAGAQLELSLG